MFDWHYQFYRHIPDNEEAQALLDKIEQNRKWQIRVLWRSIAYFQIVQRWAQFLTLSVKTKDIFWQDIPGYKCILKSILIEMKQRPIVQYPDALVDATLSLVQNT